MGFRIAFTRWRYPLALWILVIIEFPLTVAALTLFGIADPNTYRTKLWRDGFDNGFNSDPSTPLYAAANYRAVTIPLVWSSFITKFNLVISVFGMFILLVKSVLVPLHVLFPIISFVMHGLEVGLYAYSVYGQTSPDTIDPKHSNPGPPWYITKSCSVVALKSNTGFCQQAKGAFFVTVFMLTIFAVHVILSIHSMLLAPEKRVRLKDDESDVYNDDKGKMPATNEQQWEMMRIPDTPGTTGGLKSPVTPRTNAFNTLGGARGDLPLRQHFPPPPTKPIKEKGRFF